MNRRNPNECVGPSCVFEPLHDHAHPHTLTPSHSHTAGHDHSHDTSKRRLTVVLTITAVFMVLELIGGILSNSLALIADSAHMLTDVGALGLSLFVLWLSRRPARPEKTYGYLRLEILAALINGVALVIISGLIFWQAYERLLAPEPVEGGLMLAVAAAGLLVNVFAAWLLHASASHSLNVRGAYLHVIGDLIGSVGAMVAALIIITTGLTIADPVTSVLVALLILFGAWKLVRESVDVLLEAVPAHIDLSQVRNAIDEIPGVDDVHDLHVWTVTSGFLAMSGHAVVQDPQHNQRVLHEIHRSMRENFGIEHVTVQLERRGA
ncbi:MAG: cation diffusion facilitator family transporter [Gemmatimonadota bacterium]